MTDKISENIKFYYNIGALIIWSFSYLSIFSGSPTIFSPYSFTVILPALFLSEVINENIALFFAVSYIPLLFIIYSKIIFKGKNRIPKTTIVISLIFIFLSIANLMVSWKYGMKHQGITHTFAMVLINLIFWVMLVLLFRNNRKTDNNISNYLFHLLFFVWFSWVSFPWLGELI